MKKTMLILAALAVVSVPALAERKLVAAEVKGARIQKPGKIVISNDDNSISAVQVHNDVSKALVFLKSARTIRRHAFGSVIYDSYASLNTPVPIAIAPIIEDAARQHGVDPRLLAAVARRESRFSATVISPVGAVGVMQLMPATAKFLGVTDSFDPRQNIFGGARYLKMLLETFGGDLDLALAAYNAGPGAVRKYRGIPPYRETRNYVAAIRREYEAAIRLLNR